MAIFQQVLFFVWGLSPKQTKAPRILIERRELPG